MPVAPRASAASGVRSAPSRSAVRVGASSPSLRSSSSPAVAAGALPRRPSVGAMGVDGAARKASAADGFGAAAASRAAGSGAGVTGASSSSPARVAASAAGAAAPASAAPASAAPVSAAPASAAPASAAPASAAPASAAPASAAPVASASAAPASAAPASAAPAASASPSSPSSPSSPPLVLLPSQRISELSPSALEAATSRPAMDLESIVERVRPIVAEVRAGGDAALVALARRFDRLEGESLPHGPPCVPIGALPSEAEDALSEEVKAAFRLAYENIRTFHAAQRVPDLEVETRPGVTCRRVTRAIGRVGLYVPGGSAVLPSTALMLAVPAQLAGCGTVVLATPPRPDGSVSPEVLFCARLAGVTHVLRAGGAQAVAALALGTDSCPKVDKVLGPGNQFVTGAKVHLAASSARVAIDMPAGPSEVLVVADGTADPRHVALDLLSQAEHGPDSQAVLVALPGCDLAAVRAALARELDALPRRDAAARALRHSRCLEAATPDEAVAFADLYAPEHLIVNARDPERYAAAVSNAGSVFLGPHTPESVGDYASGTNHTLPTYGYARMYSGVSLDSYQRKMTVQTLTKRGLEDIGPAVATMAAVEGLDAHRRAVTVRLGIDD